MEKNRDKWLNKQLKDSKIDPTEPIRSLINSELEAFINKNPLHDMEDFKMMVIIETATDGSKHYVSVIKSIETGILFKYPKAANCFKDCDTLGINYSTRSKKSKK